jgi:hypothetical protein
MYEILLKLFMHTTQPPKILPDGLDAKSVAEVMKAMYEALHALDITSSALLIFNGVLITAAAFAAEKPFLPRVLHWWAIIVILVGLVASALCLRVTHISYPFYGKVEIVSGTKKVGTVQAPGAAAESNVIVDFREEFIELDHEIALRTCYFQIAWWLSRILVWGSVLAILLGMIEHRLWPRAAAP